MKTALITGMAGQDGSYLAELLLTKDYRVIGAVRDVKSTADLLPAALVNRVELVEWNMLDQFMVSEGVVSGKGIIVVNGSTQIFEFGDTSIANRRVQKL